MFLTLDETAKNLRTAAVNAANAQPGNIQTTAQALQKAALEYSAAFAVRFMKNKVTAEVLADCLCSLVVYIKEQ